MTPVKLSKCTAKYLMTLQNILPTYNTHIINVYYYLLIRHNIVATFTVYDKIPGSYFIREKLKNISRFKYSG